MDDKTKLKAARLGLLVNKRTQFWGSLLLPFEITPVKMPASAAAATLATSSHRKIWFNKDLLEGFSVEEVRFILVHELLHVLGGHAERAVDHLFPDQIPEQTRQAIKNLAADHVVNSICKRASLQTPKGVFFIPEVGYEVTYEQCVKILLNKINNITQSSCNIEGHQFRVFEVSFSEGLGLDPITVIAPEVEKGVTEEVKAEAKSLEARGLADASVSEVIKELLHVEISWDELLENWVAQVAQATPTTRTWKQLNKWLLKYALLPGRRYDLDEKYGIAVFVLDTSGSMSTSELKKLLDIVHRAMEKFRRIILIQHSVDVKKTTELNSNFNQSQQQDFLREVGEILGRGGTSHHDAFEKIQKIYEEDPDELSGVCLLTDGYSDLPTVWNQFEWVKYIPTSIVLTSEAGLGSLAPKPTIIRINE